MSYVSFDRFSLLKAYKRGFLMTLSINNGKYAFLIRSDFMFSKSL